MDRISYLWNPKAGLHIADPGSWFNQHPKGYGISQYPFKDGIPDLRLLGVTNGNSSAVNSIDTPDIQDKDTRYIDSIKYIYPWSCWT